MSSYIDIIPNDIINLIQKHRAAIKIQERAFKIFYQTFGPTWKQDIKMGIFQLDVYDYDYYAYRNNIIDPWHDYVDDENLQYREGVVGRKYPNP